MKTALALLVFIATSCGQQAKDNAPSPQPESVAIDTFADGATLITQYCAACHSTARPADNKILDTEEGIRANAAIAAKELQKGHMPPSRAEQPSDAERDALITWLRSL